MTTKDLPGLVKGVVLGAARLPLAVVGAAKSLITGHRDEPSFDPDRPVNVTEELGLDPAPVARPKRPKPVTGIDAAADPGAVDATPADVADAVRHRSEDPTAQ